MSAEPTELATPLISRQLEGIGEAIKRLAASAQQSSGPQSSVELAQNAKGATQIAVKVYHRTQATCYGCWTTPDHTWRANVSLRRKECNLSPIG